MRRAAYKCPWMLRAAQAISGRYASENVSLHRQSDSGAAAALLFIEGKGAYATSGVIALGVLGLVPLAIQRR